MPAHRLAIQSPSARTQIHGVGFHAARAGRPGGTAALLASFLATGFLAAGVPGGPALAACAIQTGRLVCNGLIEGGVTVANGITVQVNANTEIRSDPGATTALQLGAGNTLDNGGSILGSDTGIISMLDLTLNNTGAIRGVSGTGVNILSGTSRITNSGSIDGGVYGVLTGGSVSIVSNGSIAGDYAISARNDVELINSGSVTGINSAVAAGGAVTVDNSGTIGVLSPTGTAISATRGRVNIVNTGVISGRISAASGIDVVNSGTIQGLDLPVFATGGRFTLVNDGVISGVQVLSISPDAWIRNNGTMTASGDVSVLTAVDLDLVNAGDILSTGTGVRMIEVFGNATVDNSGVISGGANSVAIEVVGDATIANSGRIAIEGAATIGRRAAGIVVREAGDIRNRGLITVNGDGGAGLVLGEGSTVVNDGEIAVTGAAVTGIEGAGQLTVDNRSLISASGPGSYAIAGLKGLIVVNSGEISATGGIGIFAQSTLDLTNRGLIAGETGVMAAQGAGPARIVNDGTIIGAGGDAIVLSDAADELTLTRNSRIQGAIRLGGGGDTVNLDFSDRRSRVLVFDTLDGATVNVAGSSSWYIMGSSVIDINPTVFYMQTAGISDVRASVGGVVQRRMIERVHSERPRNGFYIEAFGGASVHRKTGDRDAFRNVHAGALIGADGEVFNDAIIGGFIGGAGGKAMASGVNADSASATYVVGGFYGRFAPGLFFLEANVTGGVANSSTKMHIVSNLATGGEERFSSSRTGRFITPEVAVGLNLPLTETTTISPAVRYSYTAINWSGGKSGSATGLAVNAAPSRASSLRAEVRATHTARLAGAIFRMHETVGVLREKANGGDFTLTMAGVSLPSSRAQRNVNGVFASAGFEWLDESGMTLFGSIRGDWRSDNSLRVNSRGGAKWSF